MKLCEQGGVSMFKMELQNMLHAHLPYLSRDRTERCVGVVCVKEVRVEPSRREACVVLVYETVAPVERATDVESDPAHARLVDRLVSASSARAPPCAGLRYHSCAHLKSAQVLTLRTVCAWHCAGSRMQIRRILENAMALR